MGGRKRRDLLGQVFGRLRVAEDATPERVPGRRAPDKQWRCTCACGGARIAKTRYLVAGRITHCGCGNGKDILGQTFGRLTVIKRIPARKSKGPPRARWLCRCACGNTHEADGMGLRNGQVQSCGCLRRENYAKHLASMRAARRRGAQRLAGKKFVRAEDAFDEVFGAAPVVEAALDAPKRWDGVGDAAADLARAMGMS